uniref:Rhodanese domain-containing protein n=1 Tax=Rhabditophanes sp. KR3021 TaxID=114890 RepID=A0AC35TKE8_9BILA
MTNLEAIIDSNTLAAAIKDGSSKFKIIDCTFSVGAKQDWKIFRETEWGRFDMLIKKDSKHKQEYITDHLPGAILFDLDCAMFPGQYERFSFYPVEIFEEYVRRLGINKNDHLVLYSRGPLGGNMFASRVFKLFEMYGHTKLSLLNGGYAKWKADGFATQSGEIRNKERGNWVGVDFFKLAVTFEELEKKNNDGKSMIDSPDKITFLDARPESQFKAQYIKGFHNLPVDQLVNSDGTIKSHRDVEALIEAKKIDKNKPIITSCITGTQASFLSFVIEHVVNEDSRLYNGSLMEMQARDPSRIIT